ncbi:hypothetical protein M0805_005628 [Coniferiporia weirii]|nr:hypothetical protein M0805_005628 [Coniferiporia weirii]
MICRRLLPLFLSFAISFLWFSQTASAAILAIDYGSEWIKASVMKPGVPFDVLLNRDSKRKIQSSVAWKGEDRLFSSDAFNIATRFPLDSFTYLKILQGVPFDSDAVDAFRSVSPAELTRTKRDTVAIRRSNGNGTEWSVEELIAMQFSYVKDLAESVGSSDAREPVRDAVVVVPSYFTQFERDAVADALELAGLRLLALVNDGTAVALNYAMTRSFTESKEYHVIYDAGASGVRATVASFEAASGNGKKGKDGTQITVAGVGYDRSSGGLELDRRLRDMLALDFEVKHNRPITGDARGMAKLLKESGRVKAILSANTDATATIESIAFDVDYRSKVSRSAFETACADLKPKFSQPILDAIRNAGLTLDDITSVILTGGHSRTPMVQAAVKAAVGESRIATSVNADEAAVLGAALYGASISRQFRTKDIKVTDIIPYDIQVSYLAQPKAIDAEDAQAPLKVPKTLNNLIFPAGSKVGSKKTMTFKRKDDFVVTMSYRGSVGAGLPTELLEAEIIGVKEALAELAEAGAIDPVVKATLALSESGFAGIQDAVAYGEIKKDESFAGKLKGFFGGAKGDVKDESSSEATSSETSSSSSPSATASESAESESVSPSESASSSSSAASPSPSPEKKKEVRDTIPLKLSVKPLSIPALTPTEVRRSRDRLISIDTAEAAKRRREEARNGLEAYLYRLRDLLEDDETSPFKKCSKEEEREVIQEKVTELLHWMNEEADDAQLIDFWDKKDAVERLERPIQFRYQEIEAFPSALNNSQRVNWMNRMFITEARKNLTAELVPGNLPAFYTAEEIDTLEKSLKEHESWLNEWVEKQKSVKANEDPVILTTEMKARAKTLENAALKLMRRKTPPKSKKAASSSSSSSSSSASLTSSESVPNESGSPSGSGSESGSTEESTPPASPHSPHDEL